METKGLQQFWESLSARQLTNLGHLQHAARVAESMRGHAWNVAIRQARQVNARDFRNGNFIILGSSHANPWAALFQVHDATSATELAGEFLLRGDSIEKTLRMLGLPASSPLPELEMVLRITEVNEVGDSVALVACRKLTSQPD